MPPPFPDRKSAGCSLGTAVRDALLRRHLEPRHAVVLALTRGGVPVGVEVAKALQCLWEPLVVRKVGAPHQSEVAVGAVADADPPVTELDLGTMALCGVDANWVRAQAELELPEMRRRRQLFVGTRPAPSLAGKVAVVVDDGLATGTTMRAAIRAVRTRQPAQIVVAVPVAPLRVIEGLRARVDGVVCLRTPEIFEAVGLHYLRFPQVEDEEVCAALKTAPADSEVLS